MSRKGECHEAVGELTEGGTPHAQAKDEELWATNNRSLIRPDETARLVPPKLASPGLDAGSNP
jgi:hypothetical protein